MVALNGLELGNSGGGLGQGHDGGRDDKDGSGGELHGELEWIWVVGVSLNVVAMDRSFWDAGTAACIPFTPFFSWEKRVQQDRKNRSTFPHFNSAVAGRCTARFQECTELYSNGHEI